MGSALKWGSSNANRRRAHTSEHPPFSGPVSFSVILTLVRNELSRLECLRIAR